MINEFSGTRRSPSTNERRVNDRMLSFHAKLRGGAKRRRTLFNPRDLDLRAEGVPACRDLFELTKDLWESLHATSAFQMGNEPGYRRISRFSFAFCRFDFKKPCVRINHDLRE